MPEPPSPDSPMPEPEACWNLSRNCSISPKGLMLNIAALVGVLCAIGLGFWLAGYPIVFVLCAVDAVALASAFLVHAAHAVDGERIVVAGQTIEVHAKRGLRSRIFRLNSAWTRLEGPGGTRPPALCCGPTRVPVGVYLTLAERRQFAADFRRTVTCGGNPHRIPHPS